MKLRPKPFTAEHLSVLIKALNACGVAPEVTRLGFRAPHPLVVGVHLQRFGFRIIPTNPKTKVPLISKWPELASTDPGQLIHWYQTFRNPNFSILTGRDNDLVLLDADGARGLADLERLQNEHAPIPPTWQSISGRPDGGRHIYLHLPPGCEDARNQQPLAGTKIDIRGWHGHIVVPGSLHKSGARYQWAPGCAPDEVEIAECPSTWWEMLPKKEFGGTASRRGERRAKTRTSVTREHDRNSYVIGDGPGCGGFQDPIYKNAIRCFLLAGKDASEELLVQHLWRLIQQAPKDPERSIERYEPGRGELERIVRRALEFVISISKGN